MIERCCCPSTFFYVFCEMLYFPSVVYWDVPRYVQKEWSGAVYGVPRLLIEKSIMGQGPLPSLLGITVIHLIDCWRRRRGSRCPCHQVGSELLE